MWINLIVRSCETDVAYNLTVVQPSKLALFICLNSSINCLHAGSLSNLSLYTELNDFKVFNHLTFFVASQVLPKHTNIIFIYKTWACSSFVYLIRISWYIYWSNVRWNYAKQPAYLTTSIEELFCISQQRKRYKISSLLPLVIIINNRSHYLSQFTIFVTHVYEKS